VTVLQPPSSKHASWRALAIFAPAYVLLVLIGALWSLATPIFAAPDEDAHAVKAIAAVRGDILGEVEEGSKFPSYHLPAGDHFPPGMMCFAFNPAQSANCGVEFGDSSGSATFHDWVSTYNPVYYYIVGWPSLIWQGPTAIYAMRLVSVLFSSLFLAAAFVVGLRAARSRWMPAALGFLGAPMLAFLAGAISPQAVEFSAGALFTICLLRIGERITDPDGVWLPAPALWTLTAISGAALALARATGPLWVVLLVVLAFTAVGWRTALRIFTRPLHYIGIGVIVAAMIFSTAWTLSAGTLSGQAEGGDAPLVGGGVLSGAWAMLRATPYFLQSAVGVFGWEDTQLPALAYGIEMGSLILVFALAVVAARRRDRIVLIGALVGAILVPVIVQAASVSRTGIIWQGRYGLFLYLSVILLAGWVLSRTGARASWLAAPMIVVINGLGWLFGTAAFLVVLRRYVVGGGTIDAMLHSPLWQPPLGWIPLTVAAAAVLGAFAVWNSVPALVSARRERRAVPVDA
jgi:hypothetical protein